MKCIKVCEIYALIHEIPPTSNKSLISFMNELAHNNLEWIINCGYVFIVMPTNLTKLLSNKRFVMLPNGILWNYNWDKNPVNVNIPTRNLIQGMIYRMVRRFILIKILFFKCQISVLCTLNYRVINF